MVENSANNKFMKSFLFVSISKYTPSIKITLHIRSLGDLPQFPKHALYSFSKNVGSQLTLQDTLPPRIAFKIQGTVASVTFEKAIRQRVNSGSYGCTVFHSNSFREKLLFVGLPFSRARSTFCSIVFYRPRPRLFSLRFRGKR